MTFRAPDEPVLSTLNLDGTRRWMRPVLQPGQFWRRRLLTAWGLIALFVGLPFLHIGGKPSILLDLPSREFTFFGVTLLPTDSVLLMLLMLAIFVSIFLLTALYGRVWCGWGCPQTVYLEFVFRPIERLIEGNRKSQERLDKQRFPLRRWLKFAVYAVLAVVVANVFLAYFVGVDDLMHWIKGPPHDHPAGFAVIAATSVLMFLDFAWFRDQMCVVACPYARLQSVLIDRKSLIVAYDSRRGEPRGKLEKTTLERKAGDCVDCGACVITCPTGIDIRKGLQLECVGCTQCIDACDTVMDRIKRPRGLIRYTSQEEMETGKRPRILRPRVVLYPLLLLVIAGLFAFAVARRGEAEVTVLRGLGDPFSMQPDGQVANQVRVRVDQHGDEDGKYTIALEDAAGKQLPDVTLVVPENPLHVRGGQSVTTIAFVLAPASSFHGGVRRVVVKVSDGEKQTSKLPFSLFGPAGGAAP